MARTTTEIIQDHLSKRLEGDVEGDIKKNFSPDIVILSSFGVFRGHEGVRQSAAKLATALKKASFEYSHLLIEDEYAFLEWRGEGDDNIVSDGVDSFVVRNDKIVLQTIHYSAVKK